MLTGIDKKTGERINVEQKIHLGAFIILMGAIRR